MLVTPIAHTTLFTEGMSSEGAPTLNLDPVIERWMLVDDDHSSIDSLHEFAGRACYQSFKKPNAATAKNADYLTNILGQAHESVLEHGSVTFYVTGVSRALTHELIRHRHLSFSELSQRFVNMEDAEFVAPPAVDAYWETPTEWVKVVPPEGVEEPVTVHEFFGNVVHDLKQSYSQIVKVLESTGALSRKQVREAARAVMPNATETRIVVTGNLRAWRDVIKKRHHVAADAEIRQFASEVLKQLRKVAPNSVQDIPDGPYGAE